MRSRALSCALVLAVTLTGGSEALAARTGSATMTPPTVEGPPYKDSTLRCSPAQAGDAATWVWLRDGAAVAGATGDTSRESRSVGHERAAARAAQIFSCLAV